VSTSKDDDHRLRDSIRRLLADGLKTRTEPVPKDDLEYARITAELADLQPLDFQGKLVVAGLVDHPRGDEPQRCLECMYYAVHRQWCDVPELNMPVEPDWWCRLWRI
jgi:hypothetical protein